MVHAERYAYSRCNKNAPKPSKKATNHKDNGKHPTHIDANSSNHFSVNSRSTCYFAYFCFICQKP